jgi:pimeloyl-ACP methyl ester carboxylesterase
MRTMSSGRQRRLRVIARVVTIAFTVLAACPCAFASNPTLDLNQYAHTAWTARQGFFDGVIRAITPTQDGYLWLGTERGLVRFDGVRAVPWTFPPNQGLSSKSVLSLLATRDGSLWIGTVDGLARWKGGTLTHYPELADHRVLSLTEDRTGKVWATSFRPAGASLCEIRDGSAVCFGHDGIFGPWVRGVYEDPDGRLWVYASSGLWRWTPGPRKRYPLPNASTWFQTAQPLVQGGIPSALILIAGGLRSFMDGQVTSYAVSGVPRPFTPLNLLRTRDGALWIGTLERGLLRVAGRTSTISKRNGLSSDHIFSSFQDREGNVWVGTAGGLDRFCEQVATPIAVDQTDPMTVLAAHDGSMWMGTLNGLNRWHDSDLTTYRRNRGLPGDSIGSLVEDDRGRVWASTDRGIARFENGRFRQVRSVPARWVPGYGFSGKPTTTGWGVERMARAWPELMKRLGYTRYVAQGGDWGAFVVDYMALQAPSGLVGIHTNMPGTVPADVDKAAFAGDQSPSSLSAEEKRAYEGLVFTYKHLAIYQMMASRPQTLYGLADSPVALAAYLMDHGDAGGEPAAALVEGMRRTSSGTGELTRDDILDNITLYWLTNTGVSASRLYWEYKGGFFNVKGVKIPTAVSVFPGEQYQAPRSWTERAYPKLIYYHQAARGGHFAAWEQPTIFSEELRAAFKSLR